MVSTLRWAPFLVYKDNLYSISYELLKNNIDNIDNYDPRSVMLFMTPELGRSKSQETNLSLSENMIEIPIIFEGETDGLFDENDRIIFYGRGQSGFDVNGDNVDWNRLPRSASCSEPNFGNKTGSKYKGGEINRNYLGVDNISRYDFIGLGRKIID